MMRRLHSIIACSLLFAGCGGSANNDDLPVEPERFPALPEAEPLDWSSVELGTGLRSGSAIATAFQAGGVYGDIQSNVPHVFYYVQAYDEGAPRLGGYVFNDPPPANSMEQPATAFITDGSLGFFEPRVDDIYDEVASADAEAGSGGFESESVVIDLWRLRRDWWVRWDGNLDDESNTKGKGPYGMSREDMQSDILDQLEAVAADHSPRYFIIGDDMDLLLAGDSGDGFSIADYSNFLQFFEKAVTRIKDASPNTRVGAGINWDRFVERVAPQYYDEGRHSQALDVLDYAFEAVVLPLAEIGDVVSLETYRGPNDETIDYPVGELTVTESYQFLRRLNDLYMLDKPIVFYSVGTSVESPVSYLPQQNLLEAFATWTAGVEPELVAWRTMANLAGSQSADQQLGGTCRTLTQDPFMMPVSTCYDGLIDAVFSTKDPYDYLIEQRQ